MNLLKLKKFFKAFPDEQMTVAELIDESALDISLSKIPIHCRVTLTCVLLREPPPPKPAAGLTIFIIFTICRSNFAN